MVKMVLHDWRSGWKQAWKGLWKAGGVGFNILVACSSICSCTGIYRDFSKGGKIALFIQFVLFPLVLFLNAMYPNRLSKPMHMAPLKREEKQKYLVTALKIKVISITILQCVINTFFVLAGWMSVMSAVFSVISLLLFSFAISFQTNYFETRWDIMDLFIFLTNYFAVICMTDASMKGGKIVFSCVMLVLQLLICIITVKKQYKSSMEKALDYERVYVIRKKKA